MTVRNFESSLSARRVWIEIDLTPGYLMEYSRHSLRGECGLKYNSVPLSYFVKYVTLCEESVD